MLFPTCWFDATKTKAGLEALQHYRRDYNTRLDEFKATPTHDWAEHGASAFRYLALRHKTPEAPRPAVDEYSYDFPSPLSWLST
jgi:phage terminase large subunit